MCKGFLPKTRWRWFQKKGWKAHIHFRKCHIKQIYLSALITFPGASVLEEIFIKKKKIKNPASTYKNSTCCCFHKQQVWNWDSLKGIFQDFIQECLFSGWKPSGLLAEKSLIKLSVTERNIKKKTKEKKIRLISTRELSSSLNWDLKPDKLDKCTISISYSKLQRHKQINVSVKSASFYCTVSSCE